jgi:hypothetical protein
MTEDEKRAKLEELLRKIKNVRWAEIPPFPNLYVQATYYASEEGDIVSARLLRDKRSAHYKDGHYVRKITHRIGGANARTKYNERPFFITGNSGIGNCRGFLIEKCVYLAFNSGGWDDDIKIDHIDGDICNCRLNNLKAKSREYEWF